ncbi:MAG: transporter [Bacteroidales bacterium]|nr:transporter [Candidatus Colicola faecequi]
MLKFFKDNALFVAMAVGFFFGGLEVNGLWPWLAPSWMLPLLIFFMLFFTFCKINPLDLRLHKWHWLAIVFQIVVCVALFYLLRPLDLILAQGVMICVLMPAATAGPIIAGKLGGSIQSITSFTLLSSVVTAIIVPAFFPFVNPEIQLPFLTRFLQILQHISPLLIGPFLAAWALRLISNAIYRRQWLRLPADNRPATPKKFVLSGFAAQLPFYVWVFTLVLLMSQMTRNLHSYYLDGGALLPLIGLFAGALLTCMLQFYVGKKLGERYPCEAHGEDYHDVLVNPAIYDPDPRQITRISAGQALGQKNTTLAIWMAHTYLNPVSALAPAAYILSQNLYNSWQLSRPAKGHKASE